MGRCPSCGTWNSLVETLVGGGRKGETRLRQGHGGQVGEAKLQRLSEIKEISSKRIPTGIEEFNRVLGGGIVLGSVTLLAGEPGIGKSTLMLQLENGVSRILKDGVIVYVSGEESPEQIKIRAGRLGVKAENLLFFADTDVDGIIDALEQTNKIALVIIDSIQTLYTSDLTGTAGSVGQVRECASRLLNFAKSRGIPMFLIGHVTKEGAIAGPMVLAHLVDTVLFFEGERYQSLRLLRAVKNRFGPTDEVGVFEMRESGLEEVSNPSSIFLGERLKQVSGSVVTCLMEGSRPLMVEIQALAVSTQLAIPRRVGQGIDFNRLQLLVAVLSRRCGLPLATFDIFVNVAGGIKVAEPGADLPICLAIASAVLDTPLDPKICAIGEIGLLGEIRQIGNMEKRAKEARRLGFSKVVSPKDFSELRTVIKNFVKG